VRHTALRSPSTHARATRSLGRLSLVHAGGSIPIPLEKGSVDVAALARLVPVQMHDASLKHTSAFTTSISEFNASTGQVLYRGYDVVELANNSSFLEVSYLLIYGELPSENELLEWTQKVRARTQRETRFLSFFRLCFVCR
jgi:citrate synthase